MAKPNTLMANICVQNETNQVKLGSFQLYSAKIVWLFACDFIVNIGFMDQYAMLITLYSVNMAVTGLGFS